MGLLLLSGPRAATLAIAVTLAMTATPARADDDPGLFDATSHRRFDNVKHWTKVFDDPTRDAWQRPGSVIETLSLRPGMVVADVGAGTGYFSSHLSKAVGSAGTVYAVETEPNLVEHLRERAESEATANVVPVLASFDNPRLPRASLDLILFVDTFHHVDDRRAYFTRLASRLREGGRVAIIDWKKEELPVGPELDHKLARSQVIEEMKMAGYALADESRSLPNQYFLIFSSREP